MPALDVEQRANGSLLLTAVGRRRWVSGLAGIGGGALLATATVSGEGRPLEAAILLPLALIALLAGVAALRHRDWILLDAAAREVVHRRGLASLFRAARTFPFDEVEAIRVDGSEGGEVAVALVRSGPEVWPIAWSGDRDEVGRLVGALQRVGGWRVVRSGAAGAPADRTYGMTRERGEHRR